jgi:hypothetical protein
VTPSLEQALQALDGELEEHQGTAPADKSSKS